MPAQRGMQKELSSIIGEEGYIERLHESKYTASWRQEVSGWGGGRRTPHLFKELLADKSLILAKLHPRWRPVPECLRYSSWVAQKILFSRR